MKALLLLLSLSSLAFSQPFAIRLSQLNAAGTTTINTSYPYPTTGHRALTIYNPDASPDPRPFITSLGTDFLWTQGTPSILSLSPDVWDEIDSKVSQDELEDAISGIETTPGPQGPQGIAGPAGVKGDTGLQGEVGPAGETGPQGVKGDTGDQGLQGVKGDTGDQGIQGIQGVKGDKGDAGETGPKGDTGNQGIQGPIGLTGDTGIQGPKGDKGDTGDVGPKGEEGEQGIQGPKGDKGDQGNVGLKGDTGEQGIQGVKGDTGLQGIQGIQGVAGTNGTNGTNGSSSNVTAGNGIAVTGTFPNFVVSRSKRQETYSGTTNASGAYTVTFGTAFASAPNIQANIINGADNQNLRITAISTTGFTVLTRNRVDVIGLLPTWNNATGLAVDVIVTEK